MLQGSRQQQQTDVLTGHSSDESSPAAFHLGTVLLWFSVSRETLIGPDWVTHHWRAGASDSMGEGVEGPSIDYFTNTAPKVGNGIPNAMRELTISYRKGRWCLLEKGERETGGERREGEREKERRKGRRQERRRKRKGREERGKERQNKRVERREGNKKPSAIL